MRRIAALAVGLTLALTACGGDKAAQEPPEETMPPETSSSAPATSSSSTPGSSGTPSQGGQQPGQTAPGQTAPEKLDGALVEPADMPGWEPTDNFGDYADTAVDPEACTSLHHATIGKVASDMGATRAYTKDDLYFQEYLEVVDKGADTVAEVEKMVASCKAFTMVDHDERTPVTVARFDAPGIGEKSIGVKLTMQGEAPVDLLVVVAGHKDVLMTTTLQGEKTPQPQALELAKKSMERLKKI